MKLTRGISVVLICSFIGLAGCSGQAAEGKSDEKKTANAAERPAAPKVTKPVPKPVEKPAVPVVYIKDPTQSNAIQAFIPEDMGYGTNNEEYKKEIEKWAREMARGKDGQPGYDRRGTLDRIGANGNIIKGDSRIILEEAELVKMVLDASGEGGDVVLPIHVTESSCAPEDVAHLGEVLIASYTTRFDGSVAGRSKNIELSTKAINNVIVGVGDIFSFNTTVGPSDEAHGYQPAKEIVNKQLVMGIGGGICQTSSTLFNAVDQLRVDYVEKHHHSLNVGYVPNGRDATVSYGGKDFQFKNTSGAPFIIKGVYRKGTLTIEIRTAAKFKRAIAKR
ncbi:VanW family protein [Bacillus sp. B-jedd]|uniref:VanW family protein n=1 Tax=Bacillus sp. B-jedd TaxID=1476857 RepID=UPI00051568D9|nr:VanW family protein [Bacillus sp. B-jedd]CEG26275.1 VanW family protein [Bacillus sp. B-jedd]